MRVFLARRRWSVVCRKKAFLFIIFSSSNRTEARVELEVVPFAVRLGPGLVPGHGGGWWNDREKQGKRKKLRERCF